MKKKDVTQKRLKELLHYDPDTGIFTRKITITGGGANKGDIAGTLGKNGYEQITINRKRYYSHRLAWFYMKGYFPENEIDHIDRNPLNNKIENLREVSRSCNAKNTGPKSSCKTGIPGVFWNEKSQRWNVYISMGPGTKRGYLGVFKKSNLDEAVCHRLAAEQCLDYRSCNSNSPAYKYVQKMLKRKKLPKIIIKTKKQTRALETLDVSLCPACHVDSFNRSNRYFGRKIKEESNEIKNTKRKKLPKIKR